MITFPISQSAALMVIEPQNIKRLKAGRPLVIKHGGVDILLCFTPDYTAFLMALGIDGGQAAVEPKEKRIISVNFSPEQIDAALKSCRDLPEVER